MDEINDLRSVLKERRISINGRSRRNSPAKRIQTAEPPELTDMDIKLPHDVVSACAKRDKPPSRRQPFGAFMINVLFYQ